MAVSTVVCFAQGLSSEEADDDEDDTDAAAILKGYSEQLFQALFGLLQKAVQENYEPLQEEVMNLISISASLIEEEFSKFYNQYMPLMLEILSSVGMVTAQQKNLRAKTIEALGFMIEAVQEQKSTF